ncbi:MAG: efflux RND transporter periplasmic adaptor subunit [Proteobacteria bacterium]|nr:efflux RND transporter periplasmic adaptor subunit [Pseudomonadota bacterium]
MRVLIRGTAIVAALVAATGAGIWAGQTDLLKLPLSPAAAITEARADESRPVIYYRDPDGKPLYSPTPKTTDDGRPYIAVHDGEDGTSSAKTANPETKSADTGGARKIKFYRNPMGLPDTSPVPKKDSMGMDYIPVYEGEDSDDGSIKVSPGKIQRTGVETVAVTKRPLVKTIQAPGVVQLDERRIVVLAPRFDGYVDTVGPVTTGTHVMKGDVLANVFGQEVLNESARLLIEQLSQGYVRSEPGVKGPAGVVGATRRLQNLGVPEEFMDEVKREKSVPDTFTYRSPIDGYVLERNWSDGQGFKAGDVGFRIADVSVVWMMADVAEGDINGVKLGEPVTVTTRARPGRTFKGKVTVIYPQLNKETRTIPVRIELPNPELALLPGMYGDVDIYTGNDTTLTVPTSAVIDSGNKQIVLVDLGNGRYEPREVKLGRRGDGYVEVMSGVSDGDRVVSNGNFLIDAESNLQSALKGFEASQSKEASQ